MIEKQTNIFNDQIALLRAASILAVLGYHFFPSYFMWGYLGVDCFFVISGYLIVQLIERNSGFWGFVHNRINRLYPALIACVGFFIILGFLFLLNDEYDLLLRSSIGSLLHIQNFIEYSKSGYFVDSANFRPLLNIWSLSVEFQAYLIFSLIFLVFLKGGCRNKQVSVVFVLLILSLSCYLLSYSLLNVDPFFFSPFRIWEFFAGSLTYIFTYNRKSDIGLSKFKKSFLALFFFICLVFIFKNASVEKEISTIITVLLCVSFVLFVNIYRLPSLIKKVYLYIGSISYALYLFHYPAIEFLNRFVGSASIRERFILMIAVFIMAHLIDRIISPWITKMKHSSYCLMIGAFVLTGGAGAILYNLDYLDREIVQKNKELVQDEAFTVNYNFDCDFVSKKEYEDERCRIGSGQDLSNDPKFIVVGDSLSNSLTTVFEGLSKRDLSFSQYVQIGKGSCPIVLTTDDEKCNILRTDFLDYVSNYKNVPVIIAAQWSLYLEKDEFIIGNKIKEFQEFINILKSHGSDIYIVHSVPLGARPRTCLARLPNAEIGNCNIPYKTAHDRSSFSGSVITSIADKLGVARFEIEPYMCDEAECKVFEQGRILYLDDSHISIAGGEYLAGKTYGWWYDKLFSDK